ncbi:hypothetical protein GOM49_01540 [Clostridium bovifaecis]|uniref:Uncharacterized protein n=1 Tax=Clostridium bovifaecis TaxID=2184719 RepID=A0A6I6EK13_9CLOT|nr:hypothetical protein GOM49_01540 [Clostridium bovifaecis]
MKVEVFFNDIKEANEAANSINNSGLASAVVDLNEHYGADVNSQHRFPGTETAVNLSSLVLNTGEDYGPSSPLAAASPMASGMGSFKEVSSGNSYKLMVNTDSSNVDKVKNIINNFSGTLTDTSIDLSNSVKDIPIP